MSPTNSTANSGTTLATNFGSPVRHADHGRNRPGNGKLEPEHRRDNGVLCRVARKLHENDALLSLAVRAFRTLQNLGISVSPNHYYWPVPDLTALEYREWPVRSLPAGLDLRLQQQIALLGDFVSGYSTEWNFSEDEKESDSSYHYNNGFFEGVDAEIAYSFVRKYRPEHIIEVGGGFSTRVMAAGLRANLAERDTPSEIITIDPFPARLPDSDLNGRMKVIPKPVQQVPPTIFTSLQKDDILFLDSSHVVSVGSDVVYEYLEILPRLESGVLVHVHDVFLPSDYPREAVLKNLCFWSEQYLLQAFLVFNTEFEVLWTSSAMQIFFPEILEKAFPRWPQSHIRMSRDKRRFVPTIDGQRTWPCSFWMRRI
jgi:methyltransferase family protein